MEWLGFCWIYAKRWWIGYSWLGFAYRRSDRRRGQHGEQSGNWSRRVQDEAGGRSPVQDAETARGHNIRYHQPQRDRDHIECVFGFQRCAGHVRFQRYRRDLGYFGQERYLGRRGNFRHVGFLGEGNVGFLGYRYFRYLWFLRHRHVRLFRYQRCHRHVGHVWIFRHRRDDWDVGRVRQLGILRAGGTDRFVQVVPERQPDLLYHRAGQSELRR